MEPGWGVLEDYLIPFRSFLVDSMSAEGCLAIRIPVTRSPEAIGALHELRGGSHALHGTHRVPAEGEAWHPNRAIRRLLWAFGNFAYCFVFGWGHPNVLGFLVCFPLIPIPVILDDIWVAPKKTELFFEGSDTKKKKRHARNSGQVAHDSEEDQVLRKPLLHPQRKV